MSSFGEFRCIFKNLIFCEKLVLHDINTSKNRKATWLASVRIPICEKWLCEIKICILTFS